MNNEFKAIKTLLNSNSKIFLASHVNPDGDNVGSLLGLALALKTINKDVTVLKTDIIPSELQFLPRIDLFKEYNNEAIDILITLDSSDQKRLGNLENIIFKADKIINIDHHISNTNYGTINLVDAKASSTGEIIFKLLKYLEIKIDKDIAKCLYTAISSDTGSFMYDSTSANTMMIASELLKTGFDMNEVNVKLYQSRSLIKTKLLCRVVSEVQLYEKNTIALAVIKRELLEELGASYDDSDGIVSFINEIEGIGLSIILKEKNGITKVSMRTKGDFNVAEICGHFDGGGHIKAAGCSIEGSPDKAKEMIIDYIINEVIYERSSKSV